MTANAIDIGRRNLLKGCVGRRATGEIRPPWAIGEGFEARCERCDRCVEACESGIVLRGDGGFPRVDFRLGECTFCGACAEACPPRALDRGRGRPWRIKAKISDTCLSERGISCRSCGDVCDPGAITFRLQTGGRAAVSLEPSYCTGCGACVGVCPVNAINMRQPAGCAVETGQLEGAA